MTNPVFDPFAFLDPRRAADEMAMAHGAPVVSNAGLSDPERMRREVDAAFGTTLTQYDVADYARLLRDVEGSSPPPGGNYRITMDGSRRVTMAGDGRILSP